MICKNTGVIRYYRTLFPNEYQDKLAYEIFISSHYKDGSFIPIGKP